MGRYSRRLRELVGLSQEALARRAGISQGAVSRLEAGRAVNTPLIVVMRINAAMREALTARSLEHLSEETRKIMDVPTRGIPKTGADFEGVPIASDARLPELIKIFWQVPPRQRDALVRMAQLFAGALSNADGASS